MSLLRSPLLHFVLLGIAIFVGSRYFTATTESGLGGSPRATGDSTIRIDIARQSELRNTFFEQMGRPPSDGEWRGMLAAEVDEEILFREALARGLLKNDGGVKTRLIQKMLFLEGGAEIEQAPELLERAIALRLHEGDIVVRRILVQKMRLLGSTLDEAARPDAAAIEAAYRARAEELREPDRLSLFHIFFSSDRRPESAKADASEVLLELRSERQAPQLSNEIERGTLAQRGDPFPLGHRFEGRSKRELERSFGANFGTAVFSTELNTWSPPIESAYGFHLVWPFGALPGEIPALKRVRDRIRHQIEQERREEQLEALLSELRTRYEIDLEPSPETTPSSEAPS